MAFILPILNSVTKYLMCLSDESKVSDIFYNKICGIDTVSALLGFTKRNKSKTIGPYPLLLY